MSLTVLSLGGPSLYCYSWAVTVFFSGFCILGKPIKPEGSASFGILVFIYVVFNPLSLLFS